MLYTVVKIIARLALPLYCRNMTINNKEVLKHKGPLLLAANHPNSFLDAIILCTLFDGTVYSLARGDAFKNNLAAKFLTLFKMFPVYRVSEGVENLEENYKTFEQCKIVFSSNGLVLIFSEGRCINEWRLRPLKKGTARLAISSWQQGINLKVLPVAINYSSFRRFGKNIHICFGDIISKENIDYQTSDGLAIKEFNEKLKEQLGKYIYEVKGTDKEKLKELFFVKQPLLKRVFLFLPAMVGYLVHAPLYLFTVWLGNTLIKEEGHFDSKTIGFLFLLYPVFLLLLTAIAYLLMKQWWVFFILLVLPFTAWAYVQLKQQLD